VTPFDDDPRRRWVWATSCLPVFATFFFWAWLRIAAR